MKRHIAPLLVVIGFIIALGWINTGRQPGLKSAAVQKAEPAIPQVMNSPQAPLLSQDSEVQANPFDALIAAGKLERREARMFEAQTWEPELRKSLDLGPSVPLRRVSEVYEVPDFPYHRVRVDRVYRTDRQARVVGVTAKDEEAAPITERSHVPLSTALPGELVWETAMVADHVMVQTEARVTRERLHRALPAKTRIRDQITQSGLYLVEVPAEGERSLERAILALGQLKEVVKFAEPDLLMSGADTTPNDPLYAGDPGPQWHLPKIMAPRAWDVIKEPKTPADAETTVVAVVDTGVDYTHPDLSPNMWTNPNEIAANGLDDDENGKIDDVSGWDFIGQSTVKTAIIQDNNPMDDSGHGTHVAGIIGAVGNNALGVSGVCWGVKILPLRIIKKVGTGTYGTYSTALGALDYIKTLNRNGRVVAVANHSWGGSGYSLAMLNSINNPVAAPDPLPAGITSTFLKDVNQLTVAGSAGEQAKIKIGMTISGLGIPVNTLVTIVSGSTVTLSNYTTAARTNQAVTFSNPVRPKPYGVVHVAAAGNSRFNNDRIPTYPASIPSGFIISVGATDLNDNVAIWSGTAGSNYGRLTVDLFAPGSSIWSTKLKMAADSGYGYESRNGTSMAAPQVSGTVAVLRMWQPDLTDYQARQVVIDQVDVLTSLSQKCLSGGRLNVARVVDKLYQPILVGSGGGTGGGGSTANALQEGMAITGRFSVATDHGLFVDKGGVWAWGDNTYGQLGNGTNTASAVPVKVTGLSEVVMVATLSGELGTSGYWADSYALKADGTVWAWGSKTFGLLGDGSTSGIQTTPKQVTALSNIVWISAHAPGYHCLAVRADGTVWAWGYNASGQLGDGTISDRSSPVQVLGVSGATQAEAGRMHSVALRSDGTVYAWGKRWDGVSGSFNLLGDGAAYNPSGPFYFKTPFVVPGLSNVTFLDAMTYATGFLKSDGTVWTTGSMRGYPPGSNSPLQVTGLADIHVIAGGSTHFLAVDRDGKMFAYGDGALGALGTGSIANLSAPIAVQIPGVEAVITCAAGNQLSYALDDDGTLWSAGNNAFGQLGTGKYAGKSYAVQIPRLTNVVAIGASDLMSWARRSDGTMVTWGMNDYDTTAAPGAISYSQEPTAGPAIPVPIAELSCGRASGSGAFGAAARCVDGSVWYWGASSLWSSSSGRTPSQIAGLSNITGVSLGSSGAGSDFALAVNNTGNVYAWGANGDGQRGNGTTGTGSRTPGLVSSLNSITQVATGAKHCLALKSDGTVWAWGDNIGGQLGDGTTTRRTLPQQVSGLSSIIQVAAALDESWALASDGTIYAWGIGIGGVPVMKYKPPQGNVTKFAVGNAVGTTWVVELLSDGTVVSWALGDLAAAAKLGRAPGSTVPNTTPAHRIRCNRRN